MFICDRTNTPVTLSEVDGYMFYCAELDEDLYLIETTLKCSDAARDEALVLMEQGIPVGYCSDPELEQYAREVLAGLRDLERFKKLKVLKDTHYEFDEYVLLYLITHV